MIYQSEYSTKWQRKFALFPTYVDDGQNKVWLQHYWVRYISYPNCEKCGRFGMSGYYETSSKNCEV